MGVLWNVQGLGNPRMKRALHSHTLLYKPDFVFLSETKMRNKAAERMRVFLGFYSCFTVDCVGRSGGLIIFWKSSFDFTIRSYSRYHVEGMVTEDDRKMWNLLGLYGDPVASQRKLSWELIRRLRPQPDAPWLVGGDLNEVALNSELSGDRVRWPSLLEDFRGMMEDCVLRDLGFEVEIFTWRRGMAPNICAGRLDRCLANPE